LIYIAELTFRIFILLLSSCGDKHQGAYDEPFSVVFMWWCGWRQGANPPLSCSLPPTP